MPGRIVLPATHPQLRVLASRARFITVFASRRFGKTTLGILKILSVCGVPNPLGLIWWVAPTYRQAMRPFRQLLNAALKIGLTQPGMYSRSELRVTFVTGWTVEFRSAEIFDNLRGEGLDGLVGDEIPMIPDLAWEECLRPMLADTGGWFFGLGTPKGRRGWGYKLYAHGQNPDRATFASFKFTVYDATFIPRTEIQAAREEMPKRAFDQEFMASFLDGIGVVFEDVRDRPRLRPQSNEPVGIGVDWAKKRDYTWFVAVGADSGCVLDSLRIQKIGYTGQVRLLRDFVARFTEASRLVHIVHDQTGVGEALDDLLTEAHLEADGLIFTERTKRELVEEGIVDFEAGRLGFPFNAEYDVNLEALIQEHEDFTLTVTKTGKVTYGAPEGLHDDAVCATLLANRARRTLWREYSATGQPRIDFV